MGTAVNILLLYFSACNTKAPPVLTKVLCSSSASGWSAWQGRTLEGGHLLSRKHRARISRSPCSCICRGCTPTSHTCTQPQTTARRAPEHPATKQMYSGTRCHTSIRWCQPFRQTRRPAVFTHAVSDGGAEPLTFTCENSELLEKFQYFEISKILLGLAWSRTHNGEALSTRGQPN